MFLPQCLQIKQGKENECGCVNLVYEVVNVLLQHGKTFSFNTWFAKNSLECFIHPPSLISSFKII